MCEKTFNKNVKCFHNITQVTDCYELTAEYFLLFFCVILFPFALIIQNFLFFPVDFCHNGWMVQG